MEKANQTSIDTANLFENIIGALSVEDDLIENEQLSEQAG